MTTAKRVRLSPEARRAQLIELGVDMLATRTLDELSVEAIAQSAGISRGLLFHYFSSKQEFYVEVARAAAAEMIRRTEPDRALPPVEALRSALHAFIAYVEENPDNYKSLVRGAASGDSEMRAIFDATRATMARRIVEVIADLGFELSDRADLAVHGWVAYVEECVVRWIDTRTVSHDELLEMLTKSLPAVALSASDDEIGALVSILTAGRDSSSAGSASSGTEMETVVGGRDVLGLATMSMSVVRNSTPLSDAERRAILEAPGFGRYFTDHMVRVDWTESDGRSAGEVAPYGPLLLDPATSVLHYGQEIFEGLKVYRQPDGSVATFRPDQNAQRFARSAQRMGMAQLPEPVFIDAIEQLLALDHAWVPDDPESSLYLRPFMIATEVGLGVRPSNSYAFMLLASPAGAYFRGGVAPVSVWLSTEYTRAAPGGTGEVKCGGNYAASIVAQAHAAQQGCDQVVWLDATERRWVEEMGTNNLYFVYGLGSSARVVTPALTGTLLPGVTRDSLLTVARDLGYSAEEGKVSTDEWREGNDSGAITEVFACGTAAVITPVGTVKSAAGGWVVGDGQPGPITLQLREQLLGIQTGRVVDPHGWMHRIT